MAVSSPVREPRREHAEAAARGDVPQVFEDDSELGWLEFQAASREPEALGVTTDEVMAYAMEGGRVCPTVEGWRRLYLELPTHVDGRTLARPPLPINVTDWPESSDFVRRMRLREQVDWADQNGVLPTLHALLTALPEQEWHHLAELQWPSLDPDLH